MPKTAQMVITACCFFSSTLSAANLVVETLLDGQLEELASNNTCEFREALKASEINTIVDACIAGDLVDVIDLSGLTGTITLAWWIQMNNNAGRLTILGPGPDLLVIDENQKSIFFKDSEVSISGLTLTNGSATDGGNLEIRNADAVLSNVRILNGNGFRGGGVSILNANLTIQDSEISGNHGTQRGGGISGFQANVTIQNSTIGLNDTNGSGSAIAILQGGLTILNSTISNNRQYYSNGYEGGIFTDPINADFVFEIRNSIIANHANYYGYLSEEIINHVDFENTPLYGRKLVGVIDHSIIDEYALPDMPTMQITNSLMNADVEISDIALSELGFWGGNTRTFSLGEESRALDFGEPGFSELLCDQRGLGFPRVLITRVDAGSFESNQDLIYLNGFEAQVVNCH